MPYASKWDQQERDVGELEHAVLSKHLTHVNAIYGIVPIFYLHFSQIPVDLFSFNNALFCNSEEVWYLSKMHLPIAQDIIDLFRLRANLKQNTNMLIYSS
jgi:hypothetical protein